MCQWLCENISTLFLWPAVLQHNFIIVNQLFVKMIFSINILGPPVKDKILWQCNCRCVVIKNNCRSLLVVAKIPQHPSHPNFLTRYYCCSDIFSVCCWQWNYLLLLGGPWNGSRTQMKNISRHVLSVIDTACPIIVSVTNQPEIIYCAIQNAILFCPIDRP